MLYLALNCFKFNYLQPDYIVVLACRLGVVDIMFYPAFACLYIIIIICVQVLNLCLISKYAYAYNNNTNYSWSVLHDWLARCHYNNSINTPLASEICIFYTFQLALGGVRWFINLTNYGVLLWAIVVTFNWLLIPSSHNGWDDSGYHTDRLDPWHINCLGIVSDVYLVTDNSL